MSSKHTESGVSDNDPVESPGRLIAAAREAHSISTNDLALRLRLDVKTIKALERDDFENLPAPTFVKGYMRSIAKELEIDADRILDAYAAHASLEPPSLADFSSRPPDQVGINSAIVKTVTYIIAGTLVVLTAMWWRSSYDSRDRAVTAASGNARGTDAGAAQPLPYTYDIVEHDSGWRVAAPPRPTEADGEAAGTMGDDALPQSPPVAVGKLTVTTNTEAWVEVYDRAGNRLFYGMASADRSVGIEGEPYYRLVLGNAESVTLRFNDEDVDLAPHSLRGVARLELGSVGSGAGEVQ